MLAITPRETIAAQRGALLLAKLSEALLTSADPFTQANARRLRAKVNFFVKYDDAGMLGPNGVEAAVNDVLTSARFMARRAAA